VFERNLLGRAFYAKLGFELMRENVHNQTGFEVMRGRARRYKTAAAVIERPASGCARGDPGVPSLQCTSDPAG